MELKIRVGLRVNNLKYEEFRQSVKTTLDGLTTGVYHHTATRMYLMTPASDLLEFFCPLTIFLLEILHWYSSAVSHPNQ